MVGDGDDERGWMATVRGPRVESKGSSQLESAALLRCNQRPLPRERGEGRGERRKR